MCVTDYGVEGFIKMDLPNSWECPRCIKAIQDKKEREQTNKSYFWVRDSYYWLGDSQASNGKGSTAQNVQGDRF